MAISGALGLTVLTFSLLGNWLLAGASHTVIGGVLTFWSIQLIGQ